mgnify:CR=1 FL=1
MDPQLVKSLKQIGFGAGSCLAGLVFLHLADQMPAGEPMIGAIRFASFALIALGFRLVMFA